MNSEQPNLVLEHLKHIRDKVDRIDRRLDVYALRTSSLEGPMASAIVTDVRHNNELDELKARVDRIERRLELRGA